MTTYGKINAGHTVQNDENVGVSQFGKTKVQSSRKQKYQDLENGAKMLL